MGSPISVAADIDLTVGDVADESGIAPSAVRFYERHGVISAQRTPGNQRRFDADAACRIKVAKLAQRVGFTVREIAETFEDLPADPQPADWARIAERLLAEARQRVDDLTRVIETMGATGQLCDVNDVLPMPADPEVG